MLKGIAVALLLTTAFGAAHASAGIVMCTDPVSGKKTFTDKACPTAGSGRKVKIEATNFGQGTRTSATNGAWNSDRDHSVAGRANIRDAERRRVEAASKSGYLPSPP